MTQKLTITVPPSTSKHYSVHVGDGVLAELPKILKGLKSVSRYVIITDVHVEKLVARGVARLLKRSGLRVDLLTIPAGEEHKNAQTHLELIDAMLAKRCGRDTMILAIGGGVVGDLAGFVAATFMRGVPLVQIPTTLLAMVDSSIGGKVGIDTVHGKNLIGAFHHPEAIIADTACLKKLPQEQVVSGFMEIIKIFLTYDAKFFQLCMRQFPALFLDEAMLSKIISRAVALKAGVVARDEREAGERAVVNFGHTIGHAIEHLSQYAIPHGFCVALGVLVESKISELCGILSSSDFDVIRRALANFGIDESLISHFTPKDIVRLTLSDKKSIAGKARYVLLEKIGKVRMVRETSRGQNLFTHEVDTKIVLKALDFFTHTSHGR